VILKVRGVMRLFLVLLGAVWFAQVWADKAVVRPDLMLLSSYEAVGSVDFSQGQWVWSEKLDGVRAFWDGHQLRFRSGRLIHAPKAWLEALPPFAIDGELWLGRGKFEQTVSIVRRKQPDGRWQQIRYYIFEVPHQSGDLFQRLAKLEAFLRQSKAAAEFIRVVPQHRVREALEVKRAFKAVVSQGGEGLVVRRADLPYQTGRLRTALKLKPFEDAECLVVGYVPGRGKYEGKVGALRCQLTDGRLVRLGSGLKDQDRETPPPIGSVVTFKFMGLTQKGLPRHPVYLRLRKAGDLP